jgi:hypothetical protein
MIETFAKIFKVKPDVSGFKQILIYMEENKMFADVI